MGVIVPEPLEFLVFLYISHFYNTFFCLSVCLPSSGPARGIILIFLCLSYYLSIYLHFYITSYYLIVHPYTNFASPLRIQIAFLWLETFFCPFPFLLFASHSSRSRTQLKIDSCLKPVLKSS